MSTPGVVYAAAFITSNFAAANEFSYGDHAIDYLDRLEAREYSPEAQAEREKNLELLQMQEMDTYSEHALGYLGRLQATAIFNQPVKTQGKQIYMSSEAGETSEGIFTADKDFLSSEDKKIYRDLFDESQLRECPLYTTVISFDNAFLLKNGIDYTSEKGQAELKEYARSGAAALINNCHLDPGNVIWTGAIHYNTDNIHIHLDFVEKEKVHRKYDMLEEKSFEKLKSAVVSRIIDKEHLIKLDQLIRKDLLSGLKEQTADSKKLLEKLMLELPKDTRWDYNRLNAYQKKIDSVTNAMIQNDPRLSGIFDQTQKALKDYENFVKEIYGAGEKQLYKQAAQGKIKDFYTRAGNVLLKEAKILYNQYMDVIDKKGNYYQSKKQAAKQNYTVIPPDQDAPASQGLPEINFDDHINTELSNSYETADKVKFMDWISKAEQGNTNAMYQLGKCYYNGKGCKQDPGMAAIYFQKAADRGSPYAAWQLSKMYRSGSGVTKNIQLSNEFLDVARSNFTILTEDHPDDQLAHFFLGEIQMRINSMTTDDIKQYLDLPQDYLDRKSWINYAKAIKHYYLAGDNNQAQKRLYSLSKDKNVMNWLSDQMVKGNEDAERSLIVLSEYKVKPFAERTDDYYKAMKLIHDREVEKGIEILLSESESGNVFAQFELGKLFHYGKLVKKDIEISTVYFNQSYLGMLEILETEPDNGFLYYRIGQMFDKGYGFEVQTDQALDYYKRALNNNCIYAAYSIGKIYMYNEDYYNISDAIKYFEIAAQHEHSFALYQLGNIYGNQKFGHYEMDRSIHCKEKAANLGNIYAQYDLGYIFLDGKHVKIDLEKSDKYFRQAFPALLESHEEALENGDICFRLGQMLENGYGTDKDIPKAIEYYIKALENDYEAANYALGKLYLQEGKYQDINRAVKYLGLSAESGNVYAMYRLGMLYKKNELVQADPEQSDKYFKNALSGMKEMIRENPDNAFLYYQIGTMYNKGYGIEKSENTALKYYNQAIERKFSDALYPAAKIYQEHGNDRKAIQLYERAANQGNDMAMYQLGKIYGDKGIPYFEKAAEQGNEFAMVQLGECYYKGKGIQKNLVKAEQYFSQAADKNDFAAMRLGMIYYQQNPAKGISYLRAAAHQGNEYAKQTLEYYRQNSSKKNIAAKYVTYAKARTNYSKKVQNAFKRMTRQYEQHVQQLKHEFEYEQDIKHELSKGI